MTLIHYTAIVRSDRLLELPLEAQNLIEPGQTVEIDIDITETAPASANENLLALLRAAAETQARDAGKRPFPNKYDHSRRPIRGDVWRLITQGLLERLL